MSLTAQLFQLEQFDSDIERRVQALAEVRRRLASDPALDAADGRLEAARRVGADAAAHQRRLEGDLAEVDARIKRSQTRLYGGQVVDPRELGAIERELQHLRDQRGALEDELLAMMEGSDSHERKLAALSQATNELHQHREADRPTLAQQEADMTAALAGLRAEREALAATLDARTLENYGRIRRARGHAVVRIAGGVCGGCRVVLPPKDIQHLRSGQLVACGNCGVILHGA